jgi:hypothetical protein
VFLHSGAIDSLVKIAKDADSEQTKQEVIKTLSLLCTHSTQCGIEVCRRGVPIVSIVLTNS